jgi:hypothetical protein
MTFNSATMSDTFYETAGSACKLREPRYEEDSDGRTLPAREDPMTHSGIIAWIDAVRERGGEKRRGWPAP